jgi:hypothetical protein
MIDDNDEDNNNNNNIHVCTSVTMYKLNDRAVRHKTSSYIASVHHIILKKYLAA